MYIWKPDISLSQNWPRPFKGTKIVYTSLEERWSAWHIYIYETKDLLTDFFFLDLQTISVNPIIALLELSKFSSFLHSKILKKQRWLTMLHALWACLSLCHFWYTIVQRQSTMAVKYTITSSTFLGEWNHKNRRSRCCSKAASLNIGNKYDTATYTLSRLHTLRNYWAYMYTQT